MAGLRPSRSVKQLIDEIGVSTLARHLGHKNPSTVSSWKQRGSIPVEHFSAVIKAAEAEGVTPPITNDALVAACEAGARSPAGASA